MDTASQLISKLLSPQSIDPSTTSLVLSLFTGVPQCSLFTTDPLCRCTGSTLTLLINHPHNTFINTDDQTLSSGSHQGIFHLCCQAVRLHQMATRSLSRFFKARCKRGVSETCSSAGLSSHSWVPLSSLSHGVLQCYDFQEIWFIEKRNSSILFKHPAGVSY